MSTSYRYRTGRRRRPARSKWLLGIAAVVVIIGAAGASRIATNTKAPVKTVAGSAAARNAARVASLTALAQAFVDYRATRPNLPIKLSVTPLEICAGATPDCRSTGLVDLNFLLTASASLSSLPTDPLGGPGRYGSGFTLSHDAAGRIVLSAPRAEAGATISVVK